MLEAMRAAGWLPKLIITVPDDRSAMHSDYVDLGAWGAVHGVEVAKSLNVEQPDILARVRDLDPDFIFVVGWSRLCGPTFQACARSGVMGYHPAPLPRLRGRSALSWTILLQLERTAGSLFWIDEGTDAGALLAQETFELDERVRLGELLDLHMLALRKMLDRVLPRLIEGDVSAAVQDESAATYLSARRPEDGLINWNDDALSIDRLIRAVGRPYPGAFTWLGRKKVTIWDAKPVARPEWIAQVGQIFDYAAGAPIVRCGNGSSLCLVEYDISEGGEPVESRLKGQPRFRERSN
ncbi:methionyl-tRNA formyltransferase [Sphingomonas sp. SUN039]|uniref:methionyl-tRNA formyltransferase n=1 Tax=Sphingomonas sp. SUN039 TaxID=2937787 RepID=UPI002164C531|nr:formyltransferase family protein [Sphingomonas sp. SUN039]UVO52856.1 methionyl-tRNA formyltransferase [Sphingomonas sp. SUN039]